MAEFKVNHQTFKKIGKNKMAETKINLVANTLSKAEIESQISEKVNHLKAIFTIDDNEVREFAYLTVTNSKKQIKLVESERKKVTSLLDAEKKRFMDFEKEMVCEISSESDRVAKLIAEYDKESIRKANEDQERFNRQVQEQREKQIQEQNELNAIFGESAQLEPTFIETVVVPQTSLPKGTTGTKQFRLVDFSLVPDLFKVLDEAKVRQAMKDGIEVGGIEYYLEQKTTFR
jgi:hypothetical protein